MANQPAQKITLTHCAICARDLTDADSVALGIGPVCRKKSGYTHLSPDARQLANTILFGVATAASFGTRDDLEAQAAVAYDELIMLADDTDNRRDADAFRRLGGALIARLAAAHVIIDGDLLKLQTPYNRALNADVYDNLRDVHRGWNAREKVREFDAAGLDRIKSLLSRHFAGDFAAITTDDATSYYRVPEPTDEPEPEIDAQWEGTWRAVKGDWMVRIEASQFGDSEPVVGDRVRVTRRDGSESVVVIHSVMFRNYTDWIVEPR